MNATLTRGFRILAREGLSPEAFLRLDPFEAMRIPDLGKRTYQALREHFTAQAKRLATKQGQSWLQHALQSINGPTDKVRKLLLHLAEPAAEISFDGRVKRAFRMGFEYLWGYSKAERLEQARTIATKAAQSAKSYHDDCAAQAVVEALAPDGPHLAKFVERVAWYAAQAVAHYAASKAPDYHAAYQEAWAVHRKKQEELVRNWLSDNEIP